MPPDSALWHRVAKTVKPYHACLADTPEKQVPEKTAHARSSRDRAEKQAPPPRRPELTPAAGFDSATAARLKKGKLELEGRLDLHGMTQEEAFLALQRFVLSAVSRGLRTLLVITGKGPQGAGVLRQKLPLWLEEPKLRRHILAVSPARPKDGGGGAFYLRLRKAREK